VSGRGRSKRHTNAIRHANTVRYLSNSKPGCRRDNALGARTPDFNQQSAHSAAGCTHCPARRNHHGYGSTNDYTRATDGGSNHATVRHANRRSAAGPTRTGLRLPDWLPRTHPRRGLLCPAWLPG
jgi:hypothetical protein